MGHNYGKHFNNPNNNHNVFMGSKDNSVEEVNQLPTENHEIVEPEIVSEEVNTPEVVTESRFKEGVVSGCDKLNVRSADNKEASVLCILDKDSIVSVDISNSNPANMFYKVITPAGVEGYCMKKFITIK